MNDESDQAPRSSSAAGSGAPSGDPTDVEATSATGDLLSDGLPHATVTGPVVHTAATPSTGKKVVAGVVTLIVLVIVFAGILPKLGNYSDAWDAIKNMTFTQLAVLATTVVVSILVYVFPFQVALPGLRYWPAFMVRQTSFTISNAVPAGGAVGLGVQYSMLSSAGFSGASATSAIGITSVFNLLATLILPVMGLVAMLFVERPTTSMILGAIGGLVAVVVMVGVLTAILRSEPAARKVGGLADRIIDKVYGWIHRDPPGSVVDQILVFRTSTVDVVSQRWALLSATNLAQQLTQFAVLAAAVRITQAGEAEAVPIIAVFAAFALARLAGFIPITPGGLGTVDAGLASLLVLFGASHTDALAATLLWRAASWVPQVALGFITLIIWRVKTAHMKSKPGAPAPSTPASA